MPSRASSSEHARTYKRRGHFVEKLFAEEIGLTDEYLNDRKAKKDVIDMSGDAHSVKSGEAHWQAFLYTRQRFIDDEGFQALNGTGSLLIHCLDVFPETYADYKAHEKECKEKLKVPMADLRDRFQRKVLLKAFLNKAFFNSGEVNYLSVYHGGVFNVFRNTDVVNAFAENFDVQVNGTGHKVVMKYDNNNVGEIEVRKDTSVYKAILFNVTTSKAMKLLKDNIKECEVSAVSKNVFLYGRAIKTFGNWPFLGSPLPKANMDEKLQIITDAYSVVAEPV